MDSESFDRIVRLLASAGSRRAAVAAFLGGGVLGAAERALSKRSRKGAGGNRGPDRTNKHRRPQRKRRNRDKGRPQRSGAGPAPAPESDPEGGPALTAEAASCSSPGPSSNLKDCNFNGDDLDGFDLSSSNMKNAKFNGASLCDADLSSSTLTNADFRNAN